MYLLTTDMHMIAAEMHAAEVYVLHARMLHIWSNRPGKTSLYVMSADTELRSNGIFCVYTLRVYFPLHACMHACTWVIMSLTRYRKIERMMDICSQCESHVCCTSSKNSTGSEIWETSPAHLKQHMREPREVLFRDQRERQRERETGRETGRRRERERKRACDVDPGLDGFEPAMLPLMCSSHSTDSFSYRLWPSLCMHRSSTPCKFDFQQNILRFQTNTICVAGGKAISKHATSCRGMEGAFTCIFFP